MADDIHVRIKENDRKRVALDRQMATMKAQLAALNTEAQTLNAELHRDVNATNTGGAEDAQADGSVLTTKRR